MVDNHPIRCSKHSPNMVSWTCVTEDEGRAVKLTLSDTDVVEVAVR
ncbi:MAG: hypothetical protein ACOYOQ_00400 [Microthrixaceae bacterium]